MQYVCTCMQHRSLRKYKEMGASMILHYLISIQGVMSCAITATYI